MLTETSEMLECKLRGKTKLSLKDVLAGDIVTVQCSKDGNTIEEIAPRTNVVGRPAIANVTQVAVVSSVKDPKPDFLLLDKLLVNAFYYRLKPFLIFTKEDLIDDEIKNEIMEYYRETDIPIFFTSIYHENHMAELREVLKGNITVLSGQSGIGKTSFINHILGLQEKVGEISEKSRRGKHTTRHVELFAYDEKSFLADAPGFNVAAVHPDIDETDVKLYYPEYYEVSDECFYRGCNHLKEPKCRVKELVEDGLFSKRRYENYKDIYQEVKEREKY